ncbi:MAG: hypothetical protein R3D98_13840 [Candidatus Krumholzibacteriia bacterium]
MNYWQLLQRAEQDLAEGRLRAAETSYHAAVALRARSGGRIVLTERLPDGLGQAWRRLRGQPRPDATGRWQARDAAFTAAFATAARDLAVMVRGRLDLGPGDHPEATARALEEALFLSVDSRLVNCPLTVADLLPPLLELAPVVGRLPDLDLVPDAAELAADLRVGLADLALRHLEPLPDAPRRAWTVRLLEWLDHEPEPLPEPALENRRRWLAARLADRDLVDPAAILVRWEACDRDDQPADRRRWSRLRRLELLAGCDRRRLDIPAAHTARTLALGLPRDGSDQLAVRLTAALAVIDYRAPVADPARTWYSGAVAEDGCVRLVAWWGPCPRDVLCWRPGTAVEPLLARLRAAGDRVVWPGHQCPATFVAAAGGHAPGRVLLPLLEVMLEPLLPAEGWTEEIGRGLALARSGPWRQDWRPDLGLVELTPPGLDGELQPEQAPYAGAIEAGLLWLAILHRIEEADPALRAGLGELGRRGHPAAAFLHAAAVLGAPDKAAVDAGFAAWTLPLLWTRPDPLAARGEAREPAISRPELGGQDVAVVSGAEPAAVMRAWSEDDRRWRIVLDRPARLDGLGQLARESFGPVTLVPGHGRVHHLGSALGRLDRFLRDDREQDGLLAVCHWLRLVETHNGDLLDHRSRRRRHAGACPFDDAYAAAIADLQTESPTADGDGWGAQYAQRARRSGLVVGLAADLPREAAKLDLLWGVYDGSEASWVFLDGAAVHWQLGAGAGEVPVLHHQVLATRGRRHLSVLVGRGAFPTDLAAWFDEALASYGRPYHADLGGGRRPRLRLAANLPLPAGSADPGAHAAAVLQHLLAAEPRTSVLLPAADLERRFWMAAAAGDLGPVAWQPLADPTADCGRQLVVPQLASLALEPVAPVASTQADHWARADQERAARTAQLRRQAALEMAVLQASGAAVVDVLDARWWRWLVADQATPAAALVGDGAAESCELMPPAGPPRAALAAAVRQWYRDRGCVPGLLPGWDGPPLVAAPPLVLEGRHLHTGGADLLWPQLAATCLDEWESGRPAVRALVIAEAPPPGLAALVAAMRSPLPALIGDEPDRAPGPLAWARPADLLAALRHGFDPGTLDAVLLLELDALLPGADLGNHAGAAVLGWLGRCRIGRVDLVGGPLSPAWLAFLGRQLGGEVHANPSGPAGWTAVRRGSVPLTPRTCPQCGEHAPGEAEGLVCGACGQDLGHPCADGDPVAGAAARGRLLLGQADLGRDVPLDIWGTAAELAAVRREALAAGGRADPHDLLDITLGDGRRWRLRPTEAGARGSGSPAVLLSPPDAEERLLPRGPRREPSELVLLYDQADLRHLAVKAAPAGVDHLLGVLGDPDALAAVAPGAGGPAPTSVTTWSLAWLSGLGEAAVRRHLGQMQWAARLDTPPGAAAAATARPCSVRVHASARDMELQLGGLASHLQSVVTSLHGGLAPGVAALVAWPRAGAQGHPLSGQLDRLLTLVADAGWRAAVPGAPVVIHDQLDGAWFDARRRIGRLGPVAPLADGLAALLDRFSLWCDDLLRDASRVDTGYLLRVAHPEDVWPWLVLGQELGFWAVSPGLDGMVVDVEDVRAAREPAGGVGVDAVADLLRQQATAAAVWRDRLAATPPGGTLVEPSRPTAVGGTRRWWRKGSQDPLDGVVAEVRTFVAAPRQRTLVLAGALGTGRLQALLMSLEASAAGRAAEIWCPDPETAMRVHLLARACRPDWRPDLHVAAEATEAAIAPRAPAERRPVVLLEAQRLPSGLRYKLQDTGREPGLLMTVDPDLAAPGETWEDLFVATPREADVRRLRIPMLPARLPWEVTQMFAAAPGRDTRPHRRERGQVNVRRAGTIVECAASVTAARSSGQLGDHVLVLAPHAEDVALLARALSDRGWSAVRRRDLAALMLPGILEAVAVMADAHRLRHGEWPGGPGAEAAGRPLLPDLTGPDQAGRWAGWLRTRPEADLDRAGELLDRWRRSPWGEAAGSSAVARRRVAAWCEGPGTSPAGCLPPDMWRLWRHAVGAAVGRQDLQPVGATAILAIADAPAAGPAESLAYVCFGSEPALVHRHALGQATDRILVLYQERSPLPGDGEA